MRNDGIHMPELSEPTLDELERLAEAIGERADGFELDMPDGSVARGYRAPGIHGILPEGWRVYDIMECDSERWTPYPGYEDVAEADREDGENGRYETSLVIDDNPAPLRRPGRPVRHQTRPVRRGLGVRRGALRL